MTGYSASAAPTGLSHFDWGEFTQLILLHCDNSKITRAVRRHVRPWARVPSKRASRRALGAPA